MAVTRLETPSFPLKLGNRESRFENRHQRSAGSMLSLFPIPHSRFPSSLRREEIAAVLVDQLQRAPRRRVRRRSADRRPRARAGRFPRKSGGRCRAAGRRRRSARCRVRRRRSTVPGGVCSSALRTALTMPDKGSCSASRISFELTVNMRGTPSARLRPDTSISRTSDCGNAQPISTLIFSAVDSPIKVP